MTLKIATPSTVRGSAFFPLLLILILIGGVVFALFGKDIAHLWQKYGEPYFSQESELHEGEEKESRSPTEADPGKAEAGTKALPETPQQETVAGLPAIPPQAGLFPYRSWSRNTFPGPGHLENPGPWGPRQGSDRTEWIAAFGCSPVNPKFMLQCTDLGRLVFTNTRLGGVEFVPASVPMRYGSMVAFHPTNPKTAFALFAESPGALPGLGGWWITEDEGETWRHLVRVPAWRAQKQTFAVHPFTEDYFLGTRDEGLKYSSDKGETWSTIAFEGKRIWTLKISRDGTKLYAIVARENNPRWNDWSKGGGSLFVMELEQGKDNTPYELGQGRIWWDIDLEGEDASAGVLVENMRKIHRFRLSDRQLSLSDITPQGGDRFDYCVINPANPNHLSAGAAGTLMSGRFRWSSDGGKTWGMPQETDGWITSLQDYGPANHRSPNYWFPGGDISVGAERTLVAFVPGDPQAILYWGSNIIKGPYRSDDYGATYKPFAHGGNFKQASEIATSPDGMHLAVATNEYGFVLSKDGGLSWRGYHKYNTPEFPQNMGKGQFWSYRSSYGVAIDPTNPNVVLGAFGMEPTHILRSENFGETWQTIYEYAQKDADRIPIFFAPSNPRIIYVGNLRSADGGRTFEPIERTVAAVSSSNPDLIVSKVSGREIYYSADGGKTWLSIPGPGAADDGKSTRIWPGKDNGVAIDPSAEHDPARGGNVRLLFAGEGGAWEYTVSPGNTNQGSWKPLPFSDFPEDPYGAPPWTRYILFDPRPGHESTVYAFGGSIGFQRGEMSYRRVFRSIDGGRTWEHLADDARRGELPDYLDITSTPVVDHNGTLSFHDTAGFYQLTLP